MKHGMEDIWISCKDCVCLVCLAGFCVRDVLCVCIKTESIMDGCGIDTMTMMNELYDCSN